MRWEVAGPSEYLTVTGRGIDDIRLAKKEFIAKFEVTVRKKKKASKRKPKIKEKNINSKAS
jgi:hypothetical protein